MPARVRLVATAGPLDGRGHLGRALSLAEARWARATTIELELIRGTLTAGERARARAVGVREVPSGEPFPRATVTVVDVPDVGIVAPHSDPASLAVFDDRDAFGGRAALVIQPSQPAWNGPGEAGRVLAGYEYVPIRAGVRRRRAMVRTVRADGGRPRVLVCFGGSDPAQVTARLVPALAASLDADIDVVVGASYGGPTDSSPVPLRRDPPDLVERLATADLVLLGAGTMKFEAACLARPMLLLAVADDQLPVGPVFAATGAARFLGDGRTIEPGAVVEAIGALLTDPATRADLGATAARTVDGDGAERIVTALQALGQPAASS